MKKKIYGKAPEQIPVKEAPHPRTGGMTRRRMIVRSALATCGTLAIAPTSSGLVPTPAPRHRFSFCLNTSTINGHRIGIEQCIDTAAMAGFEGIEIWIRDLESFVSKGGDLADLRKRVEDHGLHIESSIGFAQWIVNDRAIREKAIEKLRHQMDLLQRVGCKRMAAPPAGATDGDKIPASDIARRYGQLIEVGREMNVLPQLEFWGGSANLGTLGAVLEAAAACSMNETRILADVYHMYKGGSPFEGLRLVSGAAIDMFHLNDYPAQPPRHEIRDGDRVYPGDGMAPLDQIIKILHAKDHAMILSLELFNRSYWQEAPLEVAKAGLDRMKTAVHRALES